MEAWVVQVRETLTPPAGEQPLEWLLVSSEGGPTAAWAERIVGWYEARWAIEEYFRLLKSGTRIEDRRLRAADALVKCLVFDAITAWRVFALDRYARDAPDTPVGEVLTAGEQEVIEEVVRKGQLLPPAERGQPAPADICSWVVWLARIVGFRPSKRRPLPGNEVLWRAFVKAKSARKLPSTLAKVRAIAPPSETSVGGKQRKTSRHAPSAAPACPRIADRRTPADTANRSSTRNNPAQWRIAPRTPADSSETI